MTGARITYYAAARTPTGRIGILRVTREGGRQVSRRWTGVAYRTEREAAADCERRNLAIARERAS